MISGKPLRGVGADEKSAAAVVPKLIASGDALFAPSHVCVQMTGVLQQDNAIAYTATKSKAVFEEFMEDRWTKYSQLP